MSTLTALLLLAAATSPVPASSRQVLASVSPGWEETTADVALFERSAAGAPWRLAAGPFAARVGRAGLGWGRGLHPAGLEGPAKAEGDGRAPAGVFTLRGMVGYAAEPPPGLLWPYRQAAETLRCVDDAASPRYNRWVDEADTPKDWSSAEDMRRKDELYRWVVWVGHNDAPVQPGGGSCIFLHVRGQGPTAGCTALTEEALLEVLKRLRPEAEPVLVQLPRVEWQARAKAWGLPPAP